MTWSIILYGLMAASLLWLICTCFWVCIKLFKTGDPIEDDAASYVTIPQNRGPEDQRRLPYELANISRDSLRHRSNENINYDRDDSANVPYSATGSYSLESSSQYESSGKGSSESGSQYESSGKGSSVESSVRSKSGDSTISKNEDNVSSKMGEGSVKSKTGEGSVSSKMGEGSMSSLVGESSTKGYNTFPSKNDSGIKSNASEDDKVATKMER